MDHRRPLLLLGALVASSSLAAQDPTDPEPSQNLDEGKTIRRIELKGTDSSPFDAEAATGY